MIKVVEILLCLRYLDSKFMHKAYDKIFNEGLKWKYGRKRKKDI